ncbi:LytTR family DNA-binding domain-containing protein [Thalassococcus sp. S3]|uniref:LytTR family DNA-binding domain-containing protein n=1 Tax=Thalassococcus sp. S3 TaxID=2017482 RepID=UPI00102CB2B5|nr:LytTR family DNA-binding domain-containing protein [Thalassococcus sp. S3]
MRFVANDTMLGETLAEARVLAGNWLLWAGLACVALVAGLTGPFGTYIWMPVPMRLIYWGVVIVTTYWTGLLTSFAVATWVEIQGVPAPWSVGLGAGVASVVVTLWLSALHAFVLADPFVAEFFRLLPYVIVISLAATFLFDTAEATDVPARDIAPAASEPDWLDNLPPELGRDLLLLQAQDHYLRVRTSLGDTLLRGTIGEAAEALGDYGMRVHRSWWVSRSAIVTYRSRKGARVIVLSSGDEVPVGRSYWRNVRDLIDRM